MSDWRQQEELEQERQLKLLEVLQKISRGLGTSGDALYLATELGLTTEWRQHERRS